MANWVSPAQYTAFETDDQAMEFCKIWGLLPQKALKQKLYRYKGQGMDVACEIIGFADHVFAVIRIGEQLHNIHPSYLREMQTGNYGTIKPEEAEESGETLESLETAGAAIAGFVDSENEDNAVGKVADKPAEKQNPAEKQEKQEKQEKPEKKKAEKPAKEAPITFPEVKVAVEATVSEFASVPNPFSDTDDEVVIFEQVSFVHENETIALESAWSSHSQALKKLELQIGDKLTLEAKLVAKKLNKHPVKYKINNAAKISKLAKDNN